MLTKEILLNQQKELIKEYINLNKEINKTADYNKYDELFQKRMIIKELLFANNDLIKSFTNAN